LNSYPHPIIAREGWPFLAIAVIVALIASVTLGAWSLPFWLIALFVLQFFRDPGRLIPLDPKAVLSPADGRIVVVAKAHDPYANREALKISVFMNVFNVHSNRAPVDGKIEKVQCTPFEFVIPQTGEVIELSHRWSYVPNGATTMATAISTTTSYEDVLA
jgi:phosphatidylserine decarboxylase